MIPPSIETVAPLPSSYKEANISGINWSAIAGGGLGATSISLVLMVLGSALGLVWTTPWASTNPTSFTMKAATWLIFTQWIASGLGGYITGRLRVKWMHIHDDEMFFRDTAHGFLTWALATLLTAVILTAVTVSMVGAAAKSATSFASGAGPAEAAHFMNMSDPMAYSIDELFRPATTISSANVQPPLPANAQGSGINLEAVPSNAPVPLMNAQASPPLPVAQDLRGEISRILLHGLRYDSVPDADKAYVTQVVVAHTGLGEREASQRVNDVITKLNAVKEKARQGEEQARKTTMHVSLYLAFSMLVGAFIASFAATLGGRLRDEYHAEYHAAHPVRQAT